MRILRVRYKNFRCLSERSKIEGYGGICWPLPQQLESQAKHVRLCNVRPTVPRNRNWHHLCSRVRKVDINKLVLKSQRDCESVKLLLSRYCLPELHLQFTLLEGRTKNLIHVRERECYLILSRRQFKKSYKCYYLNQPPLNKLNNNTFSFNIVIDRLFICSITVFGLLSIQAVERRVKVQISGRFGKLTN